MNVLICASEGAPYIKTGGLADVIGALPKALKKEGVDVRVIMPYYKKIKEKNTAEYIGYAYVRIADHNEYLGLFKAENDGVTYYFVDSDKYFNRDTIYGHGDDGERFAFFCFAVLEAIKVANFYPDIIHNNDWQTGLIPYILKANYNYYPEYRRIKTIYSIHNIQYQGIFPKSLLDILFMPYSNSLEFNNCVNFMKTAIMESDIINTVSPTYKDEVLTDYYGYEMNKVLELRKYDFYGIINGLDVDKYNPATDKNLYQNYDSNSFIEGKKENKRQLLTEYHANSLEAPLFGLVSRLVDQKGVDLFMPILEDVLYYSNATFFILGSGDKKYEDFLQKEQERLTDKPSFFTWDNTLALAQFAYAKAENADKNLQNKVRSAFLSYADDICAKINSDGFECALAENEYTWASTKNALTQADILLMAYQLQSEQKYIDGALAQIHYLFGRNSLNKSFMTGVGDNPPEHPHNRIHESTGAYVSGLVVGGPNHVSGGDPDQTEYLKNGHVPVAKSYIDVLSSWSTNEYAIDYTATAVYALSWFSEPEQIDGSQLKLDREFPPLNK